MNEVYAASLREREQRQQQRQQQAQEREAKHQAAMAEIRANTDKLRHDPDITDPVIQGTSWTAVAEDQRKSSELSREQALAKVAELKADPLWVKRYVTGDFQTGAEMLALQKIIARGK